MTILAVDTTSARGGVALVDGTELVAEVRFRAPDTHSRVLVPAIEFVLKAAEVRPRDLGGFAVAVGPGSFTGMRVGISTVQGLALATGLPCLGASTLEILRADVAEAAPPVFALRDAYRGEVFWASFTTGAETGRPRLGRLEDVLEEAPPGAAFVGEVALEHRARIEARVAGARFPRFEPFLAATLARWAEPRLRGGAGGGPELLRPLYVRGPDLRKGPA
jgi:tRNA threonylcarbamoyladenosine biosynthesis protein TsaB